MCPSGSCATASDADPESWPPHCPDTDLAFALTRNWKYIYNPGAEDELYDMVSDPGELRNLAEDLGYKHVLRRMKDRLVAWLNRTRDDIGSEDGWKGSSYDLYVAQRER